MFQRYRKRDAANQRAAEMDQKQRQAMLAISRLNEESEEVGFEAALLKRLVELYEHALQDEQLTIEDIQKRFDQLLADVQQEMIKIQNDYYHYHKYFTNARGVAEKLDKKLRAQLLNRYQLRIGNVSSKYASMIYVPRALWGKRLEQFKILLQQKVEQLESFPDQQVVIGMNLDEEMELLRQNHQVYHAESNHPFLVACEQGDIETAVRCVNETKQNSMQRRVLFKLANEDGYNGLHLAVLNHHLPVVQVLLGFQIDKELPNKEGYTALHMAVQQHECAIVRALLESGANANAQGEYHRTPMHIAAFLGFDDCAEILIAHGANSSQASDERDRCQTPLHCAASRGHFALVQRLVQQGAKVNALMLDNSTPLECAVFAATRPVVKFLIEHHGTIAQNHLNQVERHLKRYDDLHDLLELVQRLETMNCSEAPTTLPSVSK